MNLCLFLFDCGSTSQHCLPSPGPKLGIGGVPHTLIPELDHTGHGPTERLDNRTVNPAVPYTITFPFGARHMPIASPVVQVSCKGHTKYTGDSFRKSTRFGDH